MKTKLPNIFEILNLFLPKTLANKNASFNKLVVCCIFLVFINSNYAQVPEYDNQINWGLTDSEIDRLLKQLNKKNIACFDDETGSLTFEEVISKQFIPIEEISVNYQNTLWDKFSFQPSVKSKYITFSWADIDKATLYFPSISGGYQAYSTGLLQKNMRVKEDVSQASMAVIPTDSIDFSRPFYMKKESFSYYGKNMFSLAPFIIQSNTKLEVNELIGTLGFGRVNSRYLLVIFTSFLFFLLSYFVTKDYNYLNYSLYLLAISIMISLRVPYMFNFYNQVNPSFIKYLMVISVTAASGFYLFFAIKLLGIEKSYPITYKTSIVACKSIAIFSLIYIILTYVYPKFPCRYLVFDIFKIFFSLFSVSMFFFLLFRKKSTLVFKIILLGSLFLIVGNILSIINQSSTYFFNTVLLEIIVYIGIVGYKNKTRLIEFLNASFQYEKERKEKLHLQELGELKTRFFENISHEFRTPLTLIKLPLSQAIKNNKELEVKELNLMHNNASRLQNLIEDLLSLSELDAGKMKINKSEQDPLQQSKIICSQFNSYAESKGVDYQKAIERNSIHAYYDKSVLDKVLANLISNAIKYSDSEGEVQVSISIVNESLIMTVSDKGEGISPSDQEKIFERFYRVDESDEGKQGSGIGLALVKRLLEINNGSIEVTSKINEGSTFIATLPLEQIIQLPYEPVIEKATTKNTKTALHENLLDKSDISDKPQLLIAEDNKELLQYISSLFANEFQIINAKDGQEGIDKAIENVPELIISDWMMPNKNGLDFCKEIKLNSITSHIPFLLLTAKSTVEDKIEGYETGADAYFSKPFNFNELKAKIDNILKQRKLLFEKFSDSDVQLTNSNVSSIDVKFWNNFKQVLKENLRQSDLNASQISEHLGMSRMQLHRKLKGLTGENLSAIIKNQRMNLAKELLKNSDYRISDVCYEIGYEDKSSFSRVFKKEFGISPTQFREELDQK